jgi:hypothetical protein
MNYKIKLFFVNCILLSCLSLIIIKAVSNYFCITKQETINFFDQNEYEQEWLRGQSCLKRYDYNVFNNNEIIEILKMHDNGSYYFSSYFDSNKPGYNNNNEKNLGCYWFKNPPNGLITIYFKYRENPFNQKYPIGDYKYTFDDLLKYEICIEEAHVFWNANQKEIDPNLKIHHEIFTIHPDQNNNNNKEELIKNYLCDSRITKDKKLVRLNCYNVASNTDIILPFKPSTYKDKKIEAIETTNIEILENELKQNIIEINKCDGIMNNRIRHLLQRDYLLIEQINNLKEQTKLRLLVEAVYFDNGIRGTNSNIEINDLLKLSDGAKNVYLFSFNVKKTKYITLSPSDNPYETIQKWKKDENILSTIINESPFEWKDGDNFNLTQTVETKDIIYHINCRSTYKEKLDQWKNQCFFKPYDVKDAAQIRGKIPDGAKLYTNDNSSIYIYMFDKNLYPYSDGEIYTYYKLMGIELSGINGKEFLGRWRDAKFNGYFDTNKPPIKNIQDLKQINEQINKQPNKSKIHQQTIIRNNK